jgi:hypothetical protein
MCDLQLLPTGTDGLTRSKLLSSVARFKLLSDTTTVTTVTTSHLLHTAGK